jgi:gamma-glutamylcyclotransferase (GGCT)/AIG2-like uncharacterized protein YtfP
LSAYTGVVLSGQLDEWVPGELFELEEPAILAALDEYEGSEYKRTLVTVALDTGEEMESWVYLLSQGLASENFAFTT